jgi:hypothetical protein
MMSGCVVFKAAYNMVAKCSRLIHCAGLAGASLLYCLFQLHNAARVNSVESGMGYEVKIKISLLCYFVCAANEVDM